MKYLYLFLLLVLSSSAFCQLPSNYDKGSDDDTCENCVSEPDQSIFVAGEENGNEILRIYPNPASEFISFSGNTQVKQLAVFNLTGRQVRTFNREASNQYPIGDLPKGIYLVRLLDSKGEIRSTLRVQFV